MEKQKNSDADEYPTVEDLRVALENALEGRTREQQQRIMYHMTLKLGGLLEKDARRKRVRRNSKNEKGLKVFEGGAAERLKTRVLSQVDSLARGKST